MHQKLIAQEAAPIRMYQTIDSGKKHFGKKLYIDACCSHMNMIEYAVCMNLVEL